MIIIDKKNIMLMVVLFISVTVVLYGWFLYNDRTGVDAVRDNINAAGDKQQSAIGRIEAIEEGIDASLQTIDGVERRNKEAQEAIARNQERITAGEYRAVGSAELIRQGKSILDGIRKRGKGEN